MNRLLLVVALVAAAAMIGVDVCGQTGAAGSPIREIQVVGLAPFRISFLYTNSGTTSRSSVSGQATLFDYSGRTIEEIPIDPFQAPTGSSVTGTGASRWDVQQPGVYLLEVAVDDGGGSLRTASLTFRILPIPLPLAPAAGPGTPDMYTVYQEPASWGLVRVSAPEAWAISHGSADVVVAVIDSGIDATVPQLSGCLWTNPGEIVGNGVDDDGNGYVDDIHGWDFRDNDNSSLEGTPIYGHGTSVASIIAARPGDLPIVGVAPGVRIMDVRFLDSNNRFRSADWPRFIEAIKYATDNGADIINLSIYASGRPPTSFADALKYATDHGVIVVGIAGNEGQPQVMYPAKYDTVLAVSAITEDGILAGFSNRGPEIAVCAPGDAIPALTKGGLVTASSGTSFAAPHVTGILALILSVAPGISPDRAINVLYQSTQDLGTLGVDDWYGHGLVNALAAVSSLRP